MTDSVNCDDHGECEKAFVCSHLTESLAGLGFNRAEPTEEDLFPDAWCDNCNLIFEAHQGWSDESQKLVEIKLVCSGCYEQARIRNARTDVSFEELSNLRWQCNSCDDWHTGPCLDFSFASPVYWTEENDDANQIDQFLSGELKEPATNLLDEDICVLDGEHYFLRGILHLPIIGTNETFRWGIWGSVSKENFETLMLMIDDPRRVELAPMFSWLSNQIEEYPDTRNLKMYAHIQEPGSRPTFELEPTDHPLSQEFHYGITPERVKEIMMHRLDLPLM